MFIALWWRGFGGASWMDCPTPPVAATLSLRHEDAPLTVGKIVCGAGKKPRGEGRLYGALYARLKAALLPRTFNICPPLKWGINKTFPSEGEGDTSGEG